MRQGAILLLAPIISNAANVLSSRVFAPLAPAAPFAETGRAVSNSTQCVTNYDGKSDLFPDKIDIKYAEKYSIEYHPSYALLTNKELNASYVLYRCGTTQPTVSGASAYISVPVNQVGAITTSSMSFMEKLGVQDTLSFVGSRSSIVNPCLQKLVETKPVPVLSRSNATAAQQQATAVDVVFDDNNKRYANSVVSSEYSEGSLLAQSEWLKFFSVFFGTESSAEAEFDRIARNYDCFQSQANAAYDMLRPVVAFASYFMADEWNNFTESWFISDAPIKRAQIHDAAGRLLTGATTSFDNSDDFLHVLASADVVIDESYYLTTVDDVLTAYGLDTGEMKDKEFNSYKWIDHQRLFRADNLQNASGGYEWFESAFVSGDAVLEDLVWALHPKFAAGYRNHWFRNLFLQDSVTVATSSMCQRDPSDALPQVGDTCAQLGAFGGTSANDEMNADIEGGRSDDIQVNGDDSSSGSGSTGASAALAAAAAAAAAGLLAVLGAAL